MAILRIVGLVLLMLVANIALVRPSPLQAQEFLQNGGFEQGFTGWSGQGLSLSACDPHQGTAALGLVREGGQAALAHQTVLGALGGSYTLSGWSKLGGG